MKTISAFLFLGLIAFSSADTTLRGGEREQLEEDNGEKLQIDEIFVPAAKIDEFEMAFVEPLNEEMALRDHGRHLYGGGNGYGRYCFRAGRFGGYVGGGYGGYGHYYRKMEVNDKELVPLENSIDGGAEDAGLDVKEERNLSYHRDRVCFRFRFLICCRRKHYGYGGY